MKHIKQAPVVAFLGTAAGAAVAASAVGVAGSVYSANKSANAQKDAMKAQKKIADVNTARERIQAARQARMARASVLAGAGVEGIGGSGVEGAVSSIGSQYGGNIANINTMQTFGAQASAANQKAADWQAKGATFQTIGTIGSSMTDWTKIFNPSGIPSVDKMANK